MRTRDENEMRTGTGSDRMGITTRLKVELKDEDEDEDTESKITRWGFGDLASYISFCVSYPRPRG